MEHSITYRPAVPGDLSAVLVLLTRAELPKDITGPMLASFIVAVSSEKVIGMIGLEQYELYGLLRSFVVDAAFRGQGVGRELFRRILDLASGSGISEVFVLTTTIEDLCKLWGFHRTLRDSVPAVLAASSEFRGACPSSAVCLSRKL